MTNTRWFGTTCLTILLGSLLVAGCDTSTPEAMVASAKRYIADDDYKAATIQLRNALQQDPRHAEARFLFGKALIETGDVAAAEIELRKAIELGHPAANVNPALARALVMNRQYRTVVDEFSRVEATTPEQVAELQTALGQAQMGLGNPAGAKEAFARALAAVPTHPAALVGSAMLKAAGRDLPGALALVDEALKSSPKFIEAYELKGTLLIAAGRPDEALATYRKAIELRPTQVSAHFAIAALLIQQGNLDEAGKELQKVEQAAPKHPQTFYLSALWNYRKKNLPAARDAIQQQLRAAPNNVPGLLLAAAIAQDLKAYGQAEEHLQKALQQAPNNLPARQLLVSGYLRSGQPARALETLTPVLAAGAADATTLALAGEVYLNNNRPNDAVAYFQKASALDPKDERKRAGLGISQLARGNLAEGFRELEEAAAASSDTNTDLALISAHLHKQQYDKALVAIDALEKKRPDQPAPHNLRGLAYLGKRDQAAARKSFERALEVDAAYFPAAANLAGLDVAQKKPEDARKRLEAFVAKNPKNTQALLALAELKRQSGAKPDEVGALIAKAVAAGPTEVAPRVALVNHHLRYKDSKRAVAAAQEGLAAIPDRPELLDAAGRAQAADGATNQAIASYTRWTQLQPNSPLPLVRIAELQMASKDFATAERTLRKALEVRPDYVDAQRRLVALEVQRDRIPQALEIAKTVQKQRPQDAAGYILEGDVHARKKAWTPAIAAYRTGLKQADTPDLAIRLHAALRASGQGAEADRLATARLEKKPQEITFRLYLAESALAARDFKAAMDHYQALVAAQPENATWLNNLAWAAGRQNDPRALEYAEKANGLRPNDPAIMDTLGTLLVEKGDTQQGIALLRKASAAAPDMPALRLNLAKGLIKAGDKEAARRELADLAKLGSKFGGQAEVERLQKSL